jgi:tetratricopeptide (TPR) repeat protein
LGYLQQYDDADQVFEAALELARSAGDRRVEANILNRWAIVAQRQSDFTLAQRRFVSALECIQQTRDVERIATFQFNLALFHLQRGEYAGCLAHLPESVRLFEAMGARRSVALARCSQGLLETKLCLYEQARSTLRQALEASRQVSSRAGEALATLSLATVQARRSELSQARVNFAEACDISRELGDLRGVIDALLDLAEAELDADNVDGTAEALEQIRQENLTLQQHPELRIRATLLEAEVVLARGDIDPQRLEETTAAVDRALSDAEALNVPEILWRCHASAMELAGVKGEQVQSMLHASKADTILKRMARDLPPDLASGFWHDPRRRAVKRRARPGEASQPVIPVEGGNQDEAQATAATFVDKPRRR